MAGPGITTDAPVGSIANIRKHFNFNLFITVAILGAALFVAQFDLTWWTGMIANRFFCGSYGDATLTVGQGITIPWLSASQQSALTATGQATLAIGALSAGYLTHHFGTRYVLILAAFYGAVGSVLEITSSTAGYRFWQMVLGKCIIGLSAGTCAMAIPNWISQSAPTPIRGAVIAIGQLVGTLGALCGVIIVYYVAPMTGKKVWYIPIGVQFLGPAACVFAFFWIHESPRWLIEHDRLGDARTAMVYLRGGHSAEIDKELREIELSLEIQKTRTDPGILQLFKGSDLRRTLIVMGVSSFQVGIGQSFFGGYLVTLMVSVGIQNPFLISIIITVVTMTCVAGAIPLLDRFGRRKMLLFGLGALLVPFLVFGALVTKTPLLTGAAADASIAMIILWFIFLGLSWAIVPWVLINEIPSETLRQKSGGVALFTQYTVALIIQSVSPFIQEETHGGIGGKIIWIFAGITLIGIPWTYYMVPETKGRSLEDLDYLFREKVPAWKFQDYEIPLTEHGVENNLASDPAKDEDDIKLASHAEHVEHVERL